MGLFSKKKPEDQKPDTELIFHEGLSIFYKGESVILTLDDQAKTLRFESRFPNKNTKEKASANLALEKINRAGYLTETEIIEKSKSVGGRAVAGGLILGPLGALVGGMTGIGDKKKKETTVYAIINYSDDQVLTFTIPPFNFGYMKFIAELNKHIKTPTNIEL